MADGTVMVNLETNWFGPGGSLYEAVDNPHEFPEEWAEKPKKEEDESDEDWKDRKKRQPYAVLPSSAKILEDATTVAVVQNTAGGQVVVPSVVEGDVKSVGGALDDKGIEQPDQSTAKAEKGADAQNLQVGGKPSESGPLPAGTKKPA